MRRNIRHCPEFKKRPRYCPLLLTLFVILCARLPASAQTNPAVTVTEDASTFTLANGILTARVAKNSGSLLSIRYGPNEVLDQSGHAPGYWSHRPEGVAKVSNRVTIEPAKNTGARGEVSIKGISGGQPLGSGPGGSVIADIEIRYALARGDSALYTYEILDHKPEYPATSIGEARFIVKLNDSIFDWMTVDKRRNMQMISAYDWDHGTRTNMKEARRMNTGLYKGQVEHKYDYTAVQFDTPAFGWSSTHNTAGCWFVNPSNEYLSGGATKLELLTHRDATFTDSLTAPAAPCILNYWRGSHYGGSECEIAAGEAWTKVVGPFLLLCNRGATPDARWADALTRQKAEAARWPYDWVTGVDYPKRSERGTVTGRLVLYDALTDQELLSGLREPHASPLLNLRIGLAHADYPLPARGKQAQRTVDWQRDAKYYEFWTRVGPDGRFTIPNIRPGTYALHAIADNVLGEFEGTGIKVTPGAPLDLGSLNWIPQRYGRQLWDIGIPDRTAGEFLHGDHYYQWGLYNQYPKDFPNDVNYVIGVSDYHRDWNYAQVPRAADNTGTGIGAATTWTIRFVLPNAPKGRAILRLSLAGSSAKRISVGVNGAPAGDTGPLEDTATIRRDADRGYWREVYVPFDAALMKAGDNAMTLTIPAGNVMSGVEYDYLRLELDDTASAAK